ncbi:MarR family winged helix-turn-helix transcriptional regulator [Corynebacterium ammoniagenes]|jgi:DNA-binding MarR family transcriptional regulator|uniref:Transcriptional regulator n=2 Tax=Corynebacterium ammoniagenes TaxID=1697 RepID=A0AAV5G8S6_CORAM|nr:MarR family transcriptional regulator [Corynebacterium ammoniagenes]APT83632.1 transcriptional regulator [Corynebacterium ammoniagenes DSM 20306]AQS74619.1 transcriptional regulator [Corynebacterium ammoniagenes]EFG81633.1 transcriptional regulator, MarR family [Corynebacterium ammoniagenes DSM 20306]NMF33026.1 MarR family transcriptional regulator [Corynebacterium ammoniagenes]GJN43446.1 transcriptional regulator [Corynebacterium ammoniagenes]
MTEANNQSPSSLEDALEVAEDIQPALNKLVVIFQRTTEGGSLTTSQVSIMNQLKARGAARVSQVAAAELIRMPTASNALYQLEQRNFIERSRDEKDRRGVMVQLTKKGAAELERVSKERAEALAEILRWLDAEGLQTAREISELITKLAEIYRPTQDSQK